MNASKLLPVIGLSVWPRLGLLYTCVPEFWKAT